MSDTDLAWLLDAVIDPANGWAMGTFGAIAEFTREAAEAAHVSRGITTAEASTSRGAIRLSMPEGLRPVAYETLNRDGETWSHAVALCLPAADAAPSGRLALTELGPDLDAVRPEDRNGVLFDIGLGTSQVDVCIRTSDPGLIATLRTGIGRPLFEAGNPAMGAIIAAGPHRVFTGRLGRCEVYQPIPPADGRSPDGPHTHVLPKLLRSGRTHAATTPIPHDLIPCAHIFPPSPFRNALGQSLSYDPNAFSAFEAILATCGDPDLLRLKRDLVSAVERNLAPSEFSLPANRHARSTLRVALRQLKVARTARLNLLPWLTTFDPLSAPQAEEDDEQPPH